MRTIYKIQKGVWQLDCMLPVIATIDQSETEFDFKDKLAPLRESIDWMYFHKLQKLEKDGNRKWRIYQLFYWLNRL